MNCATLQCVNSGEAFVHVCNRIGKFIVLRNVFTSQTVHKVSTFIIYFLSQNSEGNLNKDIYANKTLRRFFKLAWCYLMLHLVFNTGNSAGIEDNNYIKLIMNIIKCFAKINAYYI